MSGSGSDLRSVTRRGYRLLRYVEAITRLYRGYVLDSLTGGIGPGSSRAIASHREVSQDDPSPFPTTIRHEEPGSAIARPLPDWWDGSDAPLVYITFGTVLGHMSIAADVYRTALKGLRHTWATLALERGIHPRVVQERLGHSTIAITLGIYSHVAPTLHDEAAQVVADLVLDA